MFNKTKNKNKKYFCRRCLQCFSNEKVLSEHKENCLIINGKQNVKLKKKVRLVLKTILNNYLLLLKYMPILSVFCVQLHQNKSKAAIKISLTARNIKITFLAALLTKLFVSIINSVKKLFSTKEKMLLTNLLKQFLKSMNIARK